MLNLSSIYFAHEKKLRGYPFNVLHIGEIDSGLPGPLSTAGKKNGAHGGGVAPWIGGALAYPTRRAVVRVFGAGARAVRRLGRRPAASAAPMDVGISV